MLVHICLLQILLVLLHIQVSPVLPLQVAWCLVISGQRFQSFDILLDVRDSQSDLWQQLLDTFICGFAPETAVLELAEAAEDSRVRSALAQVASVREIVLDGRMLHARADDGARAIPTVLQALEAGGITVSAVRIARPSLDDVYLRYTGRTFQEAESETPEDSK